MYKRANIMEQGGNQCNSVAKKEKAFFIKMDIQKETARIFYFYL